MTPCSVSIEQADVDEAAGPELEAGVGEGGFQLDGAGGGVDLVVQHGELAAVEHRLAALAPPCGRASTSGVPCLHGARHGGQGLLREGEDDGDGLELGDHGQRRGVAAWTMLPTSTWRMPMRPSIGLVMVV